MCLGARRLRSGRARRIDKKLVEDREKIGQKFPNFRFLVPNRFLFSLVAQVVTCAQAYVWAR